MAFCMIEADKPTVKAEAPRDNGGSHTRTTMACGVGFIRESDTSGLLAPSQSPRCLRFAPTDAST